MFRDVPECSKFLVLSTASCLSSSTDNNHKMSDASIRSAENFLPFSFPGQKDRSFEFQLHFDFRLMFRHAQKKLNRDYRISALTADQRA